MSHPRPQVSHPGLPGQLNECSHDESLILFVFLSHMSTPHMSHPCCKNDSPSEPLGFGHQIGQVHLRTEVTLVWIISGCTNQLLKSANNIRVKPEAHTCSLFKKPLWLPNSVQRKSLVQLDMSNTVEYFSQNKCVKSEYERMHRQKIDQGSVQSVCGDSSESLKSVNCLKTNQRQRFSLSAAGPTSPKVGECNTKLLLKQ